MRLTTNPRNPLRAPILPAVINLALVLLSLPRLMVQANPFLPWPSNTNNVVRGASRAHVLVVDVRGGGAFFGGSSGKGKPPLASIFHSELATTASKKFQEAFQEALDSGLPTQLTYGFVAGYCSGMALKRIGQTAATVLGVGFVTLQTLSYYGYIEISHNKFKTTIENMLDLNKDGKVDKSDLQQSYDRIMGVLTYNLPSGAGFVGGFWGGIRS